MRWPWSRRPPADTPAQTVEAQRIARLKRLTERLTDRAAVAADALERALDQQANTRQSGEQQWRQT
jgi:hypothetical protein